MDDFKYIEALQKQIDNSGWSDCYHRWDKKTGICEKCGHINRRIIDKEIIKDYRETVKIHELIGPTVYAIKE